MTAEPSATLLIVDDEPVNRFSLPARGAATMPADGLLAGQLAETQR